MSSSRSLPRFRVEVRDAAGGVAVGWAEQAADAFREAVRRLPSGPKCEACRGRGRLTEGAACDGCDATGVRP